MIYIDYRDKSKTVTDLYYAELLGRYDTKLHKKMFPFGDLHHGNTYTVAKAKMVKLSYELLLYPRYFPDLAPCDFFLFPDLKKSLARQKFKSNKETIAYFADLDILFLFWI